MHVKIWKGDICAETRRRIPHQLENRNWYVLNGRDACRDVLKGRIRRDVWNGNNM